MNKLLLGIMLVVSIVLMGCSSVPKPIGGDKDAHGCLVGAGYSWCDATQKCIRVWEENCTTSVAEENKHVCTSEESTNVACTLDYNPVCGEIGLNSGKTVYRTFSNGCSACAAMKVLSYLPGECSSDKTTDMCTDQKGDYLTIADALGIAKSSTCGNDLVIDCNCPDGYRKEGETCNPECYYSTPKCLAPSQHCEKTYFCNEGTGTYWITMNLTKKGCNPACVIDLESDTAEINWRCTGLSP